MLGQTELERVGKGIANRRRIEALSLLSNNEGLTLMEIADHLKANFRTASEHLRRMEAAGLVAKRYVGRSVAHRLTTRGRHVLSFLRKLE